MRSLVSLVLALAATACTTAAQPGLACLYTPTDPSGPPMSCVVFAAGTSTCPPSGSSASTVAQVAACPTSGLVATCATSSGDLTFTGYVYAPVTLELARMGCMGTFVPYATGGDAGMSDPCASSTSPFDTVGCNGGFESGTPTPNQPAGTCSGALMSRQGTCAAAGACSGPSGSDTGFCYSDCTPGPSIISTGGCPTGFRCQMLDPGTNLCFRDCDATHPCPSGMDCNSGRCIGPLL